MALTTEQRVVRSRAYWEQDDIFIGSPARPRFLQALYAAERRLTTRLNGHRKDFLLVFHPSDALRLAASHELRDYMMHGGILSLAFMNHVSRQWGLPDRFFGIKIEVRYDQPEGRVDIQFMEHREQLER